jgi:hypothetical protein
LPDRAVARIRVSAIPLLNPSSLNAPARIAISSFTGNDHVANPNLMNDGLNNHRVFLFLKKEFYDPGKRDHRCKDIIMGIFNILPDTRNFAKIILKPIPMYQ